VPTRSGQFFVRPWVQRCHQTKQPKRRSKFVLASLMEKSHVWSSKIHSDTADTPENFHANPPILNPSVPSNSHKKNGLYNNTVISMAIRKSNSLAPTQRQRGLPQRHLESLWPSVWPLVAPSTTQTPSGLPSRLLRIRQLSLLRMLNLHLFTSPDLARLSSRLGHFPSYLHCCRSDCNLSPRGGEWGHQPETLSGIAI
jgi:hypothetical protein